MAPKKKKTEASEEKTSKKKTTSKKSKDIKLTFKPLHSATKILTLYLFKKVVRIDGQHEVLDREPMIKGLPGLLHVEKDEIITVTKEQFDALDELGYIASKADISRKISLKDSVKNQHPEKLSFDEYDGAESNLLPRDATTIYTEQLTVVEE